jgi:Ca2+:H+ antiporter
MVAGGLRYERQRFNQTIVGMSASLLLLSAIDLVVPALFHFTASEQGRLVERELSLEIAVILFGIYLLSLVFSLKTHWHLFSAGQVHPQPVSPQSGRLKRSVWLLMLATLGIAVMSELLVGAIQPTANRLGLTQTFVG